MKRLICFLIVLCVPIIIDAQELEPQVQMSKSKYEKSTKLNLYPKEKKGKFGFADENGTFYIKPVFDEVSDPISFGGRKYPVCINGRWRLLKDDGSYYIHPSGSFSYDSCPFIFNGHYLLYKRDGKIYLSGVESTDVQYDIFVHGSYKFYVPTNGKSRLFYENSNPLKKTQKIEYSKEYTIRKYSELKMTVLNCRIGVFIFDEFNRPLFTSYSHIENCQLEFNKSPILHELVTNSEAYLLDSEYKPVFKGYRAALSDKSGYVLVLNEDMTVTYWDGVSYSINLWDGELSDNMKGNRGLNPHVLNTRGKALDFLNNFNKLWIPQFKDIVTTSQYKEVDINMSCGFCVVTTLNGGLNIYNRDSKLICSTDGVTEYQVVATDLLRLKQDNKYGVVNVRNGFVSGIDYSEPIYLTRSYDRYRKVSGEEVIMNDSSQYTIKDYELKLFESKKNVEYLTTSLLKEGEKVHYDEVLREYDNYLFKSGDPESYILNTRIPEDRKAYLQEAKMIVKAKETEREKARLREDLANTNIPTKWVCSKNIMEVKKGENIYTYSLWGRKGFVFRRLKGRDDYMPEIVVDDFRDNLYLDMRELSGISHPSYDAFNLVWKKKLGSHVYAIYEYTVADGRIYKGEINQFVGIDQDLFGRFVEVYAPVKRYETKWKTTRYMAIISQDGVKKILAFPECFDSIIPTEEYIKVIASDHILCVDYELKTIFSYSAEDGTKIKDCIRLDDDKWVVVGSTIHKGYVDYDNPYVVIANIVGHKIGESHIAQKSAVITNIIRYSSDEYLVFYEKNMVKRITISSDNTIHWDDFHFKDSYKWTRDVKVRARKTTSDKDFMIKESALYELTLNKLPYHTEYQSEHVSVTETILDEKITKSLYFRIRVTELGKLLLYVYSEDHFYDEFLIFVYDVLDERLLDFDDHKAYKTFESNRLVTNAKYKYLYSF